MAKLGYTNCCTIALLLIGLFALAVGHVQSAAADRDIVLTPNRTQQQPGKSVYFRFAAAKTPPPTQRQQRSSSSSHEPKERVASSAVKDNITKTSTASKASPPRFSAVPWEEPLKHAVYLVLTNKVDDVAIGSDANDDDAADTDASATGPASNRLNSIALTALARAPYQRSPANHHHNTFFGDIIQLARGRLEGGPPFALIEMDTQRDDELYSTIPPNVSALWQVEMVRHRTPSAHGGHAAELKLTVFPVARHNGSGAGDGKRDAPSAASSTIRSRTFVLRDRDYPEYFSGPKALLPTAATVGHRMERRTFDMLAGLQQSMSVFDEYRLPLHFNYNGGGGGGGGPNSVHQDQHQQHEELNIGEYYAGAQEQHLHDIGPTAATYFPSTIKYGSSSFGPTGIVLPTAYHHGSTHQHVRFPTAAESVTSTGGEFLERISTTPLTATHLHHHYYPNGVNGLVTTTTTKDQNVYDHTASGGYAHHVTVANHLQQQQQHQEHALHSNIAATAHLPAHPTVSPNHLQSLIGAGDFGELQQQLHHAGLTEHPRYGGGGAHRFQYTHQHQQPHQQHYEQQTTTAGIEQPLHHHQQQQLQIASPPLHHHHQQHPTLTTTAFYNQNEIPLNHQHVQPQQTHPYLPFSQAGIVHPRLNAADGNAAFRPNYQLVNDQFSELDPLYHQHQQQQHHQHHDLIQQHLAPHLLAHQYPGAYPATAHAPHPQHPHLHPHTLDVVPLTADGQPIQGAVEQSTLTTGKGAYEIPPERLHLDPAGNNASQYVGGAESEATAPSGPSAPSAPSGPAEAEPPNETNTKDYPDSINAQLPPPEGDDDVTVPYVDSSQRIVQTSNEVTDQPKPAGGKRPKSQKTRFRTTTMAPTTTSTSTSTTTTKRPDRLSVVRLKPRTKPTTPQGGKGGEPTTPLRPLYFDNLVTTSTTDTPPTTTNNANDDDADQSTTTTTTATPTATKRGRIRMGQYAQHKSLYVSTTTEKPVLKWMPKRTRVRVPNEFTSPAATGSTTSTTTSTTSTTEGAPNRATTVNTATVDSITPTSDATVDEDEESHTSISTSISVKVGNDRPVSDEVARQIYKGFLPTRVPSSAEVQLTRGNLAKIATNSTGLHFYRAGEADDGNGDEEEQQIARSILQHARGV